MIMALGTKSDDAGDKVIFLRFSYFYSNAANCRILTYCTCLTNETMLDDVFVSASLLRFLLQYVPDISHLLYFFVSLFAGKRSSNTRAGEQAKLFTLLALYIA